MATYAVGDLQGCLTPLQQLLDRVNFDPASDRLWLVGDLVNRGPASLETLRFLYRMRDSLCIVLGNHDLHFLATAWHHDFLKKHDTLQEILDAPDCAELVAWLRQQKLAHYDADFDTLLVHAGVPPQWSLEQVLARAAEVEAVLQDDTRIGDFFLNMYGNKPKLWNDTLDGYERLRVITNYFTRMRFCNAEGKLQLKAKSGPDQAPEGYAPWFVHPGRTLEQHRVIFGHWAALEGRSTHTNAIALDTGCVWGAAMTLYNLESGEYHRRDCSDQRQ
ncbi:symmetrical bis(5'-nucleosyl)-tetraphosphatase [Thiopseudomonas denitrificans]|uniref:Bis(5'-nucleosyl)-tetraphosphatase, symmetrical n=1 Tax=Thiopseudomonas denitrificans TaxID=1501432 RepID=A0A4R6TVT0_9GAMM|nr:symmetrical bis(5'-nucleosyl)-tetraphosphatase [Thiopseudomonas denitrificans]TDQ35376.1 bis(5'nucleosyl)-tetraphosphatase ApaH [Thiopseudomonas denitrificans]